MISIAYPFLLLPSVQDRITGYPTVPSASVHERRERQSVPGRFPALTALPIDYNTGTGTVGAQDPVLKIETVVLLNRFLGLFPEITTTIHTVMAFQGDSSPTMRALFAGDILMTMWTFHGLNQLFDEVTTWKGVSCCLTLTLLHFGHLNLVFSYSEIVK
jgi:hypothetical protein